MKFTLDQKETSWWTKQKIAFLKVWIYCIPRRFQPVLFLLSQRKILNLKWISKFWHFSFHGVCYWMILCWFESAWIRLFYFTSKSVNFFYCRFLITFKRFLVLIDYSKGTDWKQLLLLEMSECFSRWAALVGVANFEWPLLTRGVLKKVLYREASSRGPTTYPFIFQFRLKRYPFRRPSIDKWYPFHIPFLELLIL